MSISDDSPDNIPLSDAVEDARRFIGRALGNCSKLRDTAVTRSLQDNLWAAMDALGEVEDPDA